MKTSQSLWIAAVAAVAAVSTGCTSNAVEAPAQCVVELGASPARGPATAWVTIVEFADFQCPYCGTVEPTLQALDDQRSGLRWVFKHFPLTSAHPQALPAALAADCANEQGMFWEMHDLLFGAQRSLGDAAYNSYAESLGLDLAAWNDCRQSGAASDRIYADYKLGLDIGVQGTPTFFINGSVLPGAYPLADFLEVVDEVEAAAKRSGIARSDYYKTMEGRGCPSE